MTIKDIARLAGVSVSTVSRSFNDSPEVSEATKRHVLAIADSVGFELNAVARGLVTRQVGTIGLILPENFDEFKTELFHSSLHNHLRRSLERSDLDLLVGFSRNRSTGADNIRKLVSRRKVDGLILIVSSVEAETERYLKEREIPYVYAHFPPASPRSDVDWVYVDHLRGGMLAAELFLKNGYRKVALVGSQSGILEFDLRLDGFHQRLTGSPGKVEVREYPGDGSYGSGYELGSVLANEESPVEAVFCITDLTAIGVVDGLRDRGLLVPRNVSVLGYDDSPLASRLRPLLTTIRQPVQEVAYLTSERLIEMIEDRRQKRPHQPRQVALQPQLVERETTRPVTGGGEGAGRESMPAPGWNSS